MILCKFFQLDACGRSRFSSVTASTLCLVLWVCAWPVMADADSFQTLKATFEAIESIDARFKQTQTSAEGDLSETLEGRMRVKRPKKFLWETESPYPQQITTNGETVWLYDRDLDQVTVKPLGNSLSRTPAVMLSDGVDSAPSHFEITDEVQQDRLEFTLKAKAQNSHFKQFQFLFKAGTLQRLRLYDHLDQITMIEFSNVVQNSSLPDTLFEFQIPDDVDVITDHE